jgi:protease IV
MSVNYYEPQNSAPAPAPKPAPVPPPETPKKAGPFRLFFSAIGKIFNVIRIIIKSIFYLFLIIILLSFIGANAPKPLPEKFALTIAPSGVLVDQKSYIDPISLMMADENQPDAETLVRDIVDSIHYAAADKRVTHIVLQLSQLQGGGISKMNDIGQALTDFKKSGKKVIAVSENYSQDQYYLATFADEILMHEMGSLELTGFARYMNYYKSALDSLGINIHAFRSGKYKDYLEPYLRDNMSDESREHNSQWINELWTQFTQQVETSRKLTTGSVNDYINNMDAHILLASGNSAKLALEKKLVDQTLPRQGLENYLQTTIGKGADKQTYASASVKDYLFHERAKPKLAKNKLAVVVASGNIVDGYQPEGTIGGENMVELLRKVRDDKDIKALVIRVDSGGGSAFASEIIRSEILSLRETMGDKKYPIYISMGSVAASGGYWISTAGDQIWAQPTTITGSIGVFGAFPTLENSLKKIGITTDGVGTTDLAGDMRLDRPLSEKASKVIQASVDHIYQRFVHLVADSRKQKPEQIDAIAQGHVWTGNKALEIGLVDHLGSLQDVIDAIAKDAKLTDYKVEFIQRNLSPKEEFFRSLTASASIPAPRNLLDSFSSLQILNQLQPLTKPLLDIQQMRDPQGVYVKCFECVGL